MVVADEIHADLIYDGRRHIPFASLSPEVEARTLTLTSATKAFNIPGLRCAIAHFGSDALRKRFDRVPRHVRGGLGSLGQAATLAAWREGQPWLDAVLAYLDGNRRRVAHFVAERLPGVRSFAPEATFLAWLDCRALELRTVAAEVLPRAGARGALGGQRLRHARSWLRAPQLRNLATAARRDQHAHRESAAGARRAVIP